VMRTKWINLAGAGQCTFIVTIGETGGAPVDFRLQAGRRVLFWRIARDLPGKTITPVSFDDTIATVTVTRAELPHGCRYVRGAWRGGNVNVTVCAPNTGGGHGPLPGDWL